MANPATRGRRSNRGGQSCFPRHPRLPARRRSVPLRGNARRAASRIAHSTIMAPALAEAPRQKRHAGGRTGRGRGTFVRRSSPFAPPGRHRSVRAWPRSGAGRTNVRRDGQRPTARLSPRERRPRRYRQRLGGRAGGTRPEPLIGRPLACDPEPVPDGEGRAHGSATQSPTASSQLRGPRSERPRGDASGSIEGPCVRAGLSAGPRMKVSCRRT